MKLKSLLLTLFSLISITTYCQINTEVLSTKINDYFEMDRENIHLHLNKETYTSEEPIWFKAYIIDQKTKKLNSNTTNVFISLFNEEKIEISNGLFFAENGIISGKIDLDKNLKSGNYYLRTYTNYMNNFIEDESTVQKIKIVNIESDYHTNEIKTDALDFSFTFEGGSFLVEATNNVVFNVKNCLNEGIALKGLKVVNDKNEIITTFSTNSKGYGKFTLQNTLPINYKILVKTSQIDKEIILPKPSVEGINIHINNYSLKEKTIIKLETNSITLEKIVENYLLVITQNHESVFIPITKKNMLNKGLLLHPKNLFKGINSLFLIDSKNNVLSQRVFFNNDLDLNLIDDFRVTKNQDSIHLRGKIIGKTANLSIAMLPEKTLSNLDNNSILNTIIFNNYLANPINDASYYLIEGNRKKEYELDMFMISNKYKYNWYDIINNKPKNQFTFDIGITIKGKVNNELKLDDYTVNLYSFYDGINENCTLNNNEFEFKNILALNKSIHHITLYNSKNESIPFDLYNSFEGNKKTFLKPLTLANNKCESKEIQTNKNKIQLKSNFDKDATVLNTLELKAEKLINYKHIDELDNNLGIAYKISEKDAETYFNILDFISNNGYNVFRVNNQYVITKDLSTYEVKIRNPFIYLNNELVLEVMTLNSLRVGDIDEIFINTYGSGKGFFPNVGIIRIYTKEGVNPYLKKPEVLSHFLEIKNCFEKEGTNQYYESISYLDPKFETYGIIEWKPELKLDNEGNFNISTPTYSQENTIFVLQGIDHLNNLYFLRKILKNN